MSPEAARKHDERRPRTNDTDLTGKPIEDRTRQYRMISCQKDQGSKRTIKKQILQAMVGGSIERQFTNGRG